MIEKKVYSSLDIMKFVMAILIMLSHTQSEWALDGSTILHYALATSNLGVPFFFACSGFLFFSKISTISDEEQRVYYKKWSIRIWKMYLYWSLIYFSFILFNWITKGTSTTNVLSYVHKCLVVSTYPTIWFLPALWLGTSIAFILYKKVVLKWIVFLAVSFYAVCSFGDSYSGIICRNDIIRDCWSWYMTCFLSFRTGVFNGFPFVAVGLLVALGKRYENKFTMNAALAILFCLLYMVESFIIKYQHLSDYTHSGYLLLPATYFVICASLDFKVPSRPIYLELRNLSMIIFLSQRLFLTAIPSVSVSYSSFIDGLDPYTTILVLDGMIILFSLLMNHYAKKVDLLKALF